MKSLSQSDQPPGGQLKEPDLPYFLLFHQLNLYPIKDDGGGSFAFIPPPRQPPQEQPGEGLRLQTKKRDWNESETQIPPLVLMGSSGGWSDTRNPICITKEQQATSKEPPTFYPFLLLPLPHPHPPSLGSRTNCLRRDCGRPSSRRVRRTPPSGAGGPSPTTRATRAGGCSRTASPSRPPVATASAASSA